MARTGPKPARSDGCHITAKGYLRGTFDGRLRLQHDVVWEQHFGVIAPGNQIHHVNGDKLDNRIENLVSVDSVTHKRLHSGSKLIDGKWWKRCSICTLYRPLDLEWWYFSKEGWPLYGRCRPCHIKRVVADKKLRRMRARGEAAER
jgi:hypothetical protein